MSRDDFSEADKRILAQRVGQRCSNPYCSAPTAGPQLDADKALNLGVAAHITAAAAGGPRFDPRLDSDDRSSLTNGVWLCQNCAKLVDNDPGRFTVDLLRAWRLAAEDRALQAIGKTAVNLEPALRRPADKWVAVDYPPKAGITAALAGEGFNTQWIRADQEAEYVDLKGWSIVEHLTAEGPVVLKVHDPQCRYVIFVKRSTDVHG